MLVVYSLIMSAVAAYFWNERNSYRADCEGLHDANEKLAAELKTSKDTLQAWLSKPVFALLTDEQITRISNVISSNLEKPKWLH